MHAAAIAMTRAIDVERNGDGLGLTEGGAGRRLCLALRLDRPLTRRNRCGRLGRRANHQMGIVMMATVRKSRRRPKRQHDRA